MMRSVFRAWGRLAAVCLATLLPCLGTGLPVPSALAAQPTEITVTGIVACSELAPCLDADDGKNYLLSGGEFYVGDRVRILGSVYEIDQGKLVIEVMDYQLLEDMDQEAAPSPGEPEGEKKPE